MAKPYRLTTPRDHNDATNQLNKLFSGLEDDLRALEGKIPPKFDPSGLQKQIDSIKKITGSGGGGFIGGGGGGGAGPVNASIVTVTAEAGLPQSRRLTAGANVQLTDAGAGSTLEVAAMVHVFFGSAAPVAGTFALGDIVFNTNPTPGGNVGWICTIAGTPGTWKQFGPIEP